MKNNKWFTLIELVVALFLSVVAMSGLVYFFNNVADSATTISSKADSITAINTFDEELKDVLVKYQTPKRIFKPATLEDKEGFSLLLMTNSDDSEWVVIWSYDEINKQIVTWTGNYYSSYIPFYSYTSGTELANIISAASTSIAVSNIPVDDVKYFSWAYLMKMWMSPVNWNSNVKFDLVFSSTYEKEFEDLNIEDLYDIDGISYYTISLLK